MHQSSLIKQKRNIISNQIRNSERKAIKEKARNQLISYNIKQDLEELIKNTQHTISKQQLKQLVDYANKEQNKALGHIGNLIIDGVLKPITLQTCKLKLGFTDMWLWLIQVMVDHQFCTLDFLQHCIKCLSPLRSTQTVKHALSTLYKITANNLESAFLLNDSSTLLAIYNMALRPDQASQMAYLLLNQLASKDNSVLKDRMEEGELRNRTVQVVSNGLKKVQRRAKVLGCKLMRSLARQGIFLYELNHTVFLLLQSLQNMFVVELLLQYLLQIVISGQNDPLQDLIDSGLIVSLGMWRNHFFQQQNDQQLSLVIQLGRQIQGRTTEWPLSEGIHSQLQKYQLLSASYKLQQQCI